MISPIQGFSKLNRAQRLKAIQHWLGSDVSDELDTFLHSDTTIQTLFAGLSENYLSNFILPLGVVPNVMVNSRLYLVPVVTEESSVIAAASFASAFWAANGGFHAQVTGTQKKGQVHFTWSGDHEFLKSTFAGLKTELLAGTASLTTGMRKRGGGISTIELVDKTADLTSYFQLDVSFETSDAMGANFINSCLEQMAADLQHYMERFASEGKIEIIMSILSNYTPECVVKCWVECPIDKLLAVSRGLAPDDFARRFAMAVQIANADVSRAVTHNKGIYNGVDALVLATGNDWRAVEAAGHAYATRTGKYRSLSEIAVENGIFRYELTLPLAIGVVGGLTQTHPLAKFVLKMLANPSAKELMEIIAAVGMANNFSAITSLVTSGIQKGHMKMHLSNILIQLGADDDQKQKAIHYFSNKVVSFSAVENFLKR